MWPLFAVLISSHLLPNQLAVVLIGGDILGDVLVPETMIKSCWGKKLRGEKVRKIWKPGHCGGCKTASLWIA